MTDAEEEAYMSGSRAAWLQILGHALQHLGHDDPAASAAQWVAEREEAIGMLRIVCGHHGDNDWPVDLNLTDIIDKHLAKHLEGGE